MKHASRGVTIEKAGVPVNSGGVTAMTTGPQSPPRFIESWFRARFQVSLNGLLTANASLYFCACFRASGMSFEGAFVHIV